jgi:hypothetical protein
MLVHAPGHVKAILDVPTGGCIMFRSLGNARIGFIVEYDDGGRCLLDVEAKAQSGDERPALYDMQRHFNGETCLYFPEAQLVPSYRPSDIGKGYFSGGAISKVLFLTEDKFVLQAAREYHFSSFDLVTGKYCDPMVSRCHHTLSWSVMIPDADGRSMELAKFVTRPSASP